MLEQKINELENRIEEECSGCKHYNFCRTACEHCIKVDNIISMYDACINIEGK